MGIVHNNSLVGKIDNVPLVIRDVPAHPVDVIRRGSVARPIEDDNTELHTKVSVVDCNVGGGIYFFEKIARVGCGVGLELAMGDRPKIEQNYEGSSKMTGAALTYYSVGHYERRLFTPYLFAGAKIDITERIGFDFGYKVYKEEINAHNGWDRYSRFEQWKGFELIDLTVGIPYLSLNYDHPMDFDDPLRFSFYIGLRQILEKEETELAQQMDIEYKDPAIFFGLRFGRDF